MLFQVFKPFLIVLFLRLIQQFSGMSILSAYVVKIFDEVFHDAVPGTANGTHSDMTHINGTVAHARIMPLPVGDSVGSSANATSDLSIDCVGDGSGGVTSSEAYLSAVVIAVVRLVSSLVLSQLLLR